MSRSHEPGERPEPTEERDTPVSAHVDATGSAILASLLTGPAVFGGLAWLLAQWTGFPLLLPVGMLVGMGLSLYVIWLRYGKH